MTRTDFDEDICLVSELLDFCDEEGCPVLDDRVWGDDERDEYINSRIMQMVNDRVGWRDIECRLHELGKDDDYDYYVYDEDDDSFEGIDDYIFDGLKDEVRDWMDYEDMWDDEESDGLYKDEVRLTRSWSISEAGPSDHCELQEDSSIDEFFGKYTEKTA